MKNVAIVCDVMRSDLTRLNNLNHNDMDFIFLEQHLHDKPDKMREKLQEEINRITDDYDKIILGYGLCSNGIVGLKSKGHEIIVPQVDDCISLFLGSREKYMEEFKKDPATYYLCKGWIEFGSDPYRGYLVWTDQENKIPEEWFKNKERYGRKFDEETARLLSIEMMKNYNRIVLIDNNDIEDIHREYAKNMVNFMSELLNKQIIYTEIKGSSELLEKLIKGGWEQNNFIRIQPGQEILQKYFINYY